jgi:hypothetical protein
MAVQLFGLWADVNGGSVFHITIIFPPSVFHEIKILILLTVLCSIYKLRL